MLMAIRGCLEEPKDEMHPWKAEAVYGTQLVQHFKPIFNILEMINEIRRHFPMISNKYSCLFLGRIAFWKRLGIFFEQFNSLIKVPVWWCPSSSHDKLKLLKIQLMLSQACSLAVIKWTACFYLGKSKQEHNLDSYSSQRKVQQLLDSPRTLQVQLQPHSTDGLTQTLKEVRDAGAWPLG